ncbi:hypothetical protein CLOHIR_01552 [Peptacetobacter hiranonis DSM 13275]|uniref:Uncharacterized protein n=1 Tax=Peptacetobacter hiranonis (strain DSM 13275 / JCM 10541 / KCTC 15199 / TO-931) TaxID=500633 RepID=B6G095_PEPHT|nr:hypothetical protein CLOHIR_01552 [Peptacetobacter hiranonis DSM 13275]
MSYKSPYSLFYLFNSFLDFLVLKYITKKINVNKFIIINTFIPKNKLLSPFVSILIIFLKEFIDDIKIITGKIKPANLLFNFDKRFCIYTNNITKKTNKSVFIKSLPFQ